MSDVIVVKTSEGKTISMCSVGAVSWADDRCSPLLLSRLLPAHPRLRDRDVELAEVEGFVFVFFCMGGKSCLKFKHSNSEILLI